MCAGYNPTGVGMTAAWWAAVKERRPKAHAFKGKLPWVFERRVALVVGDLPRSTRVTTPATDRAIAQLMDDLEAEDRRAAAAAPSGRTTERREDQEEQRQEHETEEGEEGEEERQRVAQTQGGQSVGKAITRIVAELARPEAQQQQQQQGEEEQRASPEAQTEAGAGDPTRGADRAPDRRLAPPPVLGRDQRRRLEAALAVASIERASAPQAVAPCASSTASNGLLRVLPPDPDPTTPRKRTRVAGCEGQDAVDECASRRSKLASSVAQSSAAAAGMARGFQELVAVFQDQAARYRRLEGSLEGPGARPDARAARELADQRSVVLSIARSLEQSTRATAEMALGYHDLVRLLVREGPPEDDRPSC